MLQEPAQQQQLWIYWATQILLWLSSVLPKHQFYFFSLVGGDFFSISITVVEGPNGGFWSAEDEQAQTYLTQLVLHTGDLKKKRKNWTKDNYFQVERLSQWFTFQNGKEEKWLIVETSTWLFRVCQSAGWPRHLALVQICNKEALLGSRVLKQT